MSGNKSLSLASSETLKGIFTVAILICHINAVNGMLNYGLLGTAVQSLGYLSVGGFFFLSGYGLSFSYDKKGESYFDNFLRSKLLFLYTVNIMFIVIYSVRDIVIYNAFSLPLLIKSFFIGGTVIDKGWYIEVQCLLYLLFYLSYKFFKDKKKGTAVLTILTSVYILLCALLKLSTTWYETALCFSAGCAYAFFGKDKKVNTLFALPVLVLFLFTLYFGNAKILPEALRISLKILSSLIFVCIIIVITKNINLKLKTLSFIGKNSLLIYLTQGLFLKLFSETVMIENDLVYTLAVIGGVAIISFILHYPTEAIRKSRRKS